MSLVKRFFKTPSQSFFLFGPRGTGKSTWFREHFKEALCINLLETDVLREYSARPERLINAIDANPEKQIIIIDEVQRAPSLLSIVHNLIETRRNLRFVLTGSSARKLKKTGVDLMAGRALKKTMHPFMASELEDQFNIYKILVTGAVPMIVMASEPAEVLKTYIDIYIREEVQIEGLVRDLGAFSRFLEAAALSHGQILNIANVAHDCQVGRKTVEGYFSIIEDLLLSFKIHVFTKRAQRAIIAHPKFYFFDCGVFRSLRPKGPLDSPQEISGAALEGLVAQHIRAWIDYSSVEVTLYYWHTREGSEVDFVIYGENIFIALEVKAAERIRSENLRGLKAFTKDYPECKPALLYMGKERLQIDGINCIPCHEFLLSLKPEQAISV